MRRTLLAAAMFVAGVLALIATPSVIGYTAPAPPAPPVDVGPTMPPDTGAGELLLVVVGGVYGSRAEAEAASAAMSFGDMQGYYVVPTAQFQAFDLGIGAPGDFALVSVFRTEQGAQDFAAFASSLGYPATILPDRVRSLGGLYAGLGQEASPDGNGPLTGPIPASLP